MWFSGRNPAHQIAHRYAETGYERSVNNSYFHHVRIPLGEHTWLHTRIHTDKQGFLLRLHNTRVTSHQVAVTQLLKEVVHSAEGC